MATAWCDMAMVGQRLRKLRRAHGLSATELAARMGVSLSLISKLEHGRRRVTSSFVLALAGALGEQPGTLFDYLFAAEGRGEAAPPK